jgi:hypothetical protein
MFCSSDDWDELAFGDPPSREQEDREIANSAAVATDKDLVNLFLVLLERSMSLQVRSYNGLFGFSNA